jgi:hypothetical protein
VNELDDVAGVQYVHWCGNLMPEYLPIVLNDDHPGLEVQFAEQVADGGRMDHCPARPVDRDLDAPGGDIRAFREGHGRRLMVRR